MILSTAALHGCDLGTGSDSEPSTIVISPGALQLDAIGATATLQAEVRDSEGRALTGGAMTWTSADATVATVSPDGLVTAAANGETSVTATSGPASGTVEVSVAQVATALEAVSGEGQVGPAGEPLGELLVVRAFDRLGLSAEGVPVEFSVQEGGGGASPVQVQTDDSGTAATSWTLGSLAGQTQRMRAFLSFRVGEAVDFTATAVAGPPTDLVVVSGGGQSAPRLETLLQPVVVRVEDTFANPVGGVSVDFTAAAGSGSLEPATSETDSDGLASAAWTLGDMVGPQSASAAAAALSPLPLLASATEIPDRIEILAGDGQAGTVGEALPEEPSVRVLDAGSAPVAGLDVAFEASGGGLLEPAEGAGGASELTVRTDADGVATLGAWILGTVSGSYDLTATVSGVPPSTLTSTALAGPASSLVKFSGDGQTGAAGSPLTDSLVVRVADVYDNPIVGTTVTFQPDAGDGTVSPVQAITSAEGLARTEWTIGASAALQFVTVSIPSGPSVVFSGGEVGAAGLMIELHYIDQPTASQMQAFDAAVNRWAGLIPGRLTPQPINIPPGGCGSGSPAVDRVVDDLLVFVRVAEIDGVLGTLGQAGICAVRAGGLPSVARLTLDVADVARLESGGRLVDLILHELAHALGFGSRWAAEGFLANPSLPNNRGVDTHFTGPAAIAAFDEMGGAGYAGGQKVPVENQEGGAGTRDSHWRLSVLTNELMTGFLSTSANPLSRVTVASLEDLGYDVELLGADAYQLNLAPPSAAAVRPAEELLPLGDDVVHGPVYVFGPDGSIERVLRP